MGSSTRASQITGFDHLIVGSRKLGDLCEAWLRLGFTLTPRATDRHGARALYRVMFARHAIELRGFADASDARQILGGLPGGGERFEALALRTADVDAAAGTLRAAGHSLGSPSTHEPTIELPNAEARAAFRLLPLPARATPSLNAFLCQPLREDRVWRGAWSDHLNGARAITAVTMVLDDPSVVAIPYGELFGYDRVRVQDGLVSVSCTDVALRFMAQAALGRLHPVLARTPPPALPWLAAVEVEVESLGRCRDYLEAVGLPHEHLREGCLGTPPAGPNGFAVDFVEG